MKLPIRQEKRETYANCVSSWQNSSEIQHALLAHIECSDRKPGCFFNIWIWMEVIFTEASYWPSNC